MTAYYEHISNNRNDNDYPEYPGQSNAFDFTRPKLMMWIFLWEQIAKYPEIKNISGIIKTSAQITNISEVKVFWLSMTYHHFGI